MKLTLGADPELFLADTKGILRAACGKFGGTKDHPQPMGIGDGFNMQEDNVALEFNIPPSESAKLFAENIQKALKLLMDGAEQMYDYRVVNLSAANFPEEELTDPRSQEFGCDPDFNAWTERKNPRPKALDMTLRSCGGHVHVGFDQSKFAGLHPSLRGKYSVEVIKAMDLFLGVPSVLMDQGDMRKQLYDKAGAHRYKPYGVEYRTLSNFWVFSTDLSEWVYRNTERAVQAVDAQFPVEEYRDSILCAINDNDKTRAAMLCNELTLEVL